MSYPLRLQKLRLLPLEFRREISDLTLLFKSRNGLITMDVNKYLNTYVYCYRTRNYDPNNYNLIIKHKQDYFRKSFFIMVAELWNTLPSNLKTCNSITLFKTKITSLYTPINQLRIAYLREYFLVYCIDVQGQDGNWDISPVSNSCQSSVW